MNHCSAAASSGNIRKNSGSDMLCCIVLPRIVNYSAINIIVQARSLKSGTGLEPACEPVQEDRLAIQPPALHFGNRALSQAQQAQDEPGKSTDIHDSILTPREPCAARRRVAWGYKTAARQEEPGYPQDVRGSCGNWPGDHFRRRLRPHATRRTSCKRWLLKRPGFARNE